MSNPVAEKPKERLDIGNILYHSWGYEQTNIDFYEVVGLTPSGKSVRLRKLKADNEYDVDTMRGSATPIPGDYASEEVLTKRLQRDRRGRLTVFMEYGFVYPWDGQPKPYTSYA